MMTIQREWWKVKGKSELSDQLIQYHCISNKLTLYGSTECTYLFKATVKCLAAIDATVRHVRRQY